MILYIIYRTLYMPFSTTNIELRCSKYRLCMMINRLVKGQKALGHMWGLPLGHPTLMKGPLCFGEVTQTLSGELRQDEAHAEWLVRAE